jgi:hypothetical protein
MNDTSASNQAVLTKDIYSRSAIDQAVQDFADRLHIIIFREDEHNVAISISAVGASDDQLVREFLNHLLEISIPPDW